ncbi:MHYT domain-containing protein [Streptomyces hypolithicus]
MHGTVDGFTHGLLTPFAAYLMASLGGALGLRCVARAVHDGRRTNAGRRRRTGWLALGAAAVATGVWSTHFIAMTGFSVREASIGYDPVPAYAGLGVAFVMVGIGVLIVGHRGPTAMALVTGGTLTGLGVASLHYLAMAGMRLHGQLQYDIPTVALSVVIAVVAATVALRAAVSLRGIPAFLGAGLTMGLAVSGMHYTGMAAVGVHLHEAADRSGGQTPALLLAPAITGPMVLLVLAGALLMLDPRLLTGRPEAPDPARPGIPRPAPGASQRR